MTLRIIVFLALSQLAAAPANAVEFVPHRVGYELHLDRHSLSGDVVSSGGRMDIQYEVGCEFWTTTFMFNFDLVMADGTPFNVGFLSSTRESLDGSTFQFEHIELSSGEIIQAIAGTAHIGAGAPAEAIFTHPENTRRRLPAETMFPIAAWRDLLDNVTRGQNAAGYTLFDGWSVEGPGLLRVWASLVNLDPAAQTESALDMDLISGRSWQISSSFFPLGSSDMEPTSSAQERLFDTGVSNPIIFDWPSFVIRSEAISLQELPRPDC